MNKRVRLCLLVAAASVAFAARVGAAPRVRNLSDRDLVRYAASKFDARAMMGRHVVLGRHRGTLVAADFVCGDVCPQYTRRIVHYDVPPERCGEVGGAVVSELVPRGPAVMPKPYCEPKVLVRVLQ